MIINVPKKKQIKSIFFHLYFLNKDISLNIYNRKMIFSTDVKHIHMEESVSQIFDLGHSSFLFYKKKKGVTFCHFFI